MYGVPILLAGCVGPEVKTYHGRVPDSILQIGIVPKATEVILQPEADFTFIDRQTGKAHILQAPREYTIRAKNGGGFSLGQFTFREPLRIQPHQADGVLRIGQKRYRGNFIIRPNNDGDFSVVMELGIEEYLRGVLPAEMSPSWPLEALKAQAVVARTFALNNIGKFRSAGFDLSSDSRSQAYADVSQQSGNILRAVKDTEGEVLSWNGELLQVYFHSCCGGHTASAQEIWGAPGKPPRPLRGVSDSYCTASPEYRWTAYLSSEHIAEALHKHGFSVTRITNIRPGRREWSGFLQTVRLTADGKRIELRARDFRDWAGNMGIKSTKILRIAKRGNGFEFTGRGFGHGVGLCQWGAYYMAQRGKSYRKILTYYFPGAR